MLTVRKIRVMGLVLCEGFDQYQVMIDGSRRLTEQKKQKVPETVYSFSP